MQDEDCKTQKKFYQDRALESAGTEDKHGLPTLGQFIWMLIMLVVGCVFGYLWATEHHKPVVITSPVFHAKCWREPGRPVMWHPEGAIMLKADGSTYLAKGVWKS